MPQSRPAVRKGCPKLLICQYRNQLFRPCLSFASSSLLLLLQFLGLLQPQLPVQVNFLKCIRKEWGEEREQNQWSDNHSLTGTGSKVQWYFAKFVNSVLKCSRPFTDACYIFMKQYLCKLDFRKALAQRQLQFQYSLFT